MKIALIRQRYNPFGGAERFVERALAALGKTEIDVTLFTRKWSEQNAKTSFSTAICDPFYLGSTWRDWSFSHAVQTALAAQHFDIIQSHEKIPGCTIYRAGDGVHQGWLDRRTHASGTLQKQWITLNPYNAYTLSAERKMYRHPKLRKVICISQLVRREIQHYFDLPESALPVVYNGIDATVFNPSVKSFRERVRLDYGIPSEAPLFLFVGSGFERKGLAAAIQSLPDHAWLLVVGKDKKSMHYQEIASALGKQKRIIFTGPQQNTLPFYGAADAFVFPTLYEPFGNVILEAMATGLPIITTHDCGGAELIEESTNGFIVHTGNRDQLMFAMNSLCDMSLASQMGEASVRTASRFDLQRMTQQMVAIYQELMV